MKKISIIAAIMAIGLLLPVLAPVAKAETTAEFLAADNDHDGLSNGQEMNVYHTDPYKCDTDGDGYYDAWEVANGYSPRHINNVKLAEVDSDSDNLSDAMEIALGTNLISKDTDADSYDDYTEVYHGYDATKGKNARAANKSIKVNLTNQTADYFMNNVYLGTTLVSTGKASTPTSKGTYAITNKYSTVKYSKDAWVDGLYDYQGTKWELTFAKSKVVSGAYWHDRFGKEAVTSGNINLAEGPAEKLYNFVDIGNKIEITGTTPKGVIHDND